MHRIIAFAIICFFATCCGALADKKETFTTVGTDGCKDWMILHDDEQGCRTFWKPCGTTVWNADPCGWEPCVSGQFRPGSEVIPYTVNQYNGIEYQVAPGTGGYFIPNGSPDQCGGYSGWVFQANGTSVVVCPPLMVQFPGN